MHGTGNAFLDLVVALAVLICLWYVVQRFSPDALLTKICQIAIFVLAIFVVVKMLLPMLGVAR